MSTPDAELIVLCAEFDQLEPQVVGLFRGPAKIADDDERDSAIKPIEAAQREMAHRICAMPAATIAGMQAKARSLVTWAPDRMKGCVVNRRTAVGVATGGHDARTSEIG